MPDLHFLIKPASGLCNLRCRYCFYAREVEKREEQAERFMSREIAEHLLEEAFRTVGRGRRIDFSFQGGEPTLAGLPFFRYFVEKAREECPKGVQLSFSIQTNGLLLDEEWVSFLKKERFLTGISLDGNRETHDFCRVDHEGKGTWKKALEKAKLLLRSGVDTNVLCVVTKNCARHPQAVYNELKKNGFRYLQFIACMEEDKTETPYPWSLGEEDYGKFLCTLFDLWYQDWEKGDYHSIRLFDDYIHILLHDGASTCSTCGTCGEYLVAEADGSLYPCDFYCLDEWKIGNIMQEPLEDILNGEKYADFFALGLEKPAVCGTCPYNAFCAGGCKNDWAPGENGKRNIRCGAFKALFQHALPRMMTIARAERAAMR